MLCTCITCVIFFTFQGSLGQVDTKMIVQPLEHLLPVKTSEEPLNTIGQDQAVTPDLSATASQPQVPASQSEEAIQSEEVPGCDELQTELEPEAVKPSAQQTLKITENLDDINLDDVKLDDVNLDDVKLDDIQSVEFTLDEE